MAPNTYRNRFRKEWVFMTEQRKKDGNQILVAAAEPYPPIKAERPNPHYALLLSGNLASSKGEMTAIYRYLYQSWRMGEEQPELQKLMQRVAKVEMRHLDILGQLIELLGGDPRCMSCGRHSPVPWNGSMVHYSKGLKQMLNRNVVAEQSAADSYLKHAKMIEDPYVSAMLRRIAKDELLHRDIFSQYLEQYGGSGK